MKFLTNERFTETTKALEGHHWKSKGNQKRWDYHSKAVDVAKKVDISNASAVLEIGTMGMTIVEGSDTLDYSVAWNFEGKQPTYNHDARTVPWPLLDKQYDLVIALRVFQHLWPVQEKCFKELKRVASRAILVVPHEYKKGRGISYEEFLSFNQGIHPNKFMLTELGQLYFWDFSEPATKDLRTDAYFELLKRSRQEKLTHLVAHYRWRVIQFLRRFTFVVKGKRALNRIISR